MAKYVIYICEKNCRPKHLKIAKIGRTGLQVMIKFFKLFPLETQSFFLAEFSSWNLTWSVQCEQKKIAKCL